MCSKEALEERPKRNIEAGIRESDVLERSIVQIPLYDKLNIIKIAVSDSIPEEVVRKIMQLT